MTDSTDFADFADARQPTPQERIAEAGWSSGWHPKKAEDWPSHWATNGKGLILKIASARIDIIRLNQLADCVEAIEERDAEED